MIITTIKRLREAQPHQRKQKDNFTTFYNFTWLTIGCRPAAKINVVCSYDVLFIVYQHRHSEGLCIVTLPQREALQVPLPSRKLCRLPPPTEAGGHLTCSSNDQFQQMKDALSEQDSCTTK